MSDPSAPTIDLSPATIAQSVHDSLGEALTSIPPGQDAVFLVDATYTNSPNVQAMFAARAAKGWNVGVGVDWDGTHVGGKVMASHTWKWKTDDPPKSAIATAAQLGIHDGGNGESAQ